MTTLAPVLQVEDDENDVLLLSYAFKTAGVPNPLRVVNDGQQAIHYLSGAGKYADRRQYPLPCLMLLDLKMANKSGLEVLEWIRSQPAFDSMIVIVLSASANRSDMISAYRLGANSFVVKPTGVAPLTEFARALRAYWLTHNQFPPALSSLESPGSSA
jgi:CheY-like chemotaxis protein